MAEADISLQEGTDGAPHILALVNDTGGLNVSAISSSHHQRDLLSLHSLADTIEDETEDDDQNDIQRSYKPLFDEGDVKGKTLDNALVLLKSQNQRRIKEELLLSTFGRFQDEIDLLKEVYLPLREAKHLSLQNDLLLGLDRSQGTLIRSELEGSLSKLLKFSREEKIDGHEAEQHALRFCLSILQISSPVSQQQSMYV
jgi:hypothetical protein